MTKVLRFICDLFEICFAPVMLSKAMIMCTSNPSPLEIVGIVDLIGLTILFVADVANDIVMAAKRR